MRPKEHLKTLKARHPRDRAIIDCFVDGLDEEEATKQMIRFFKNPDPKIWGVEIEDRFSKIDAALAAANFSMRGPLPRPIFNANHPTIAARCFVRSAFKRLKTTLCETKEEWLLVTSKNQ